MSILKTFLSIKPKIIATIIYIPFLYLLGFIASQPLLIFDLDPYSVSLIGTFITFILLTLSLNFWFNIRWGIKGSWKIIFSNWNLKLLTKNFSKGFLNALFLISLIIFPVVKLGFFSWIGEISPLILLNAILLMFGVGFAEELVFRFWLQEDLKLQFGNKKSIFFQAILFSLVHIISMRLNISAWGIISTLIGLFLLGILLSLIRSLENGSLAGCIGMHGGLAGIWFVLDKSILRISINAPTWLVGPGGDNANPVGCLYGITLLFMFCIFYLIQKTKIKFKK